MSIPTIYDDLFGPVDPLLPLDIIAILLSLIALILNGILICITFRRQKFIWAIDSKIIVVIATSDVVASLLMGLGVILRHILGVDKMRHSNLCSLGSAIFCITSMLSIIFTALLAVVRYFVFVLKWELRNLLWTWSLVLTVMGVNLLFLWRLIVSHWVLVPSALYCTPLFWGEDIDTQFFGIISLILLLPSLLLIPVCYTLVTLHYRRLIIPSLTQIHIIRRHFNLTLIKMTLVVIGYPLLSFPEFLLAFINRAPTIRRDSLPDGLVILSLFSLTILNAMFTISLHNETHREWISFLRRLHNSLSHKILGREMELNLPTTSAIQ